MRSTIATGEQKLSSPAGRIFTWMPCDATLRSHSCWRSGVNMLHQ
jgi:hypothetical protein